MNFILKWQPSLEHIALVKIVTMLWNQKDVWESLVEFISQRGNYYVRKWCDIDETVSEKLQNLLIPQSLKEKAKGFISPVGKEILKWMRYHCTDCYLQLDLPAEIGWSSQGTVDAFKTAKLIIQDEKIDIVKRYKLACIYCMEETIFRLWEKIPEHLKQTFSSEYSHCNSCKENLVSFWTCQVNPEERDTIHIFYHSLCEDFANDNNVVATRYFLQELNPNEQEELLVSVGRHVYDINFLFFLLSKMNEQQQIEVFKNDPYGTLRSFLDWPYQCFFIEIANRVRDFLSESDFNFLLHDIILKQKLGLTDFDYKQLFKKFWQKSAAAHKSYVINLSGCDLIVNLMGVKDKENSRLVLKDATSLENKELIYCDHVQRMCRILLYEHKWDLLQFFIQECLSSSDEKLMFKEEMEKHLFINRVFQWNRCRWEELFCLAKNSISKDNKRIAEVGECSSSKRFHSQ